MAELTFNNFDLTNCLNFTIPGFGDVDKNPILVNNKNVLLNATKFVEDYIKDTGIIKNKNYRIHSVGNLKTDGEVYFILSGEDCNLISNIKLDFGFNPNTQLTNGSTTVGVYPASKSLKKPYFVGTTIKDYCYFVKTYDPSTLTNVNLVTTGNGYIKDGNYDAPTPTLFAETIDGLDLSNYYFVTADFYANVGGTNRVRLDTSSQTYKPVLKYTFDSYTVLNSDGTYNTYDCNGLLFQDIAAFISLWKTDAYNDINKFSTFRPRDCQNWFDIPKLYDDNDIIYLCNSQFAPVGNILTYDSNYNTRPMYALIKKDKLEQYLNFIGVPWTFSLEDAQNANISDFTDGYNPDPVFPGSEGQGNNTTSDWTGAGDNTEDSLDLTSPNFSPMQEAVNQYALNSLQLQRVSNYLFTADIFNDWDLLKNDPREGLVSCKYFPFELRLHDSDHIGNQEEIVIGGVQMDNVSAARILSGYNQILDLGEFDVMEYFGGFLDYQLTSIDIYLPYVGWQQLNASAIMNRKLKIKYVVDLNTGDCACLILSTDGSVDRFENVFTGQMGIDIPILTSNHNENVKQAGSTILSAGVAVGGAIATFASGGTLAPVALAGAGATIANSASSVATMMNHQKLGTPVGSSLSMWMPQDIIFRITRPTKSEASEFKNRRGYRSNYSTQLKNVTGFVQIDDPFLDGLSLHEGEKEQLAQILKGGIFI